MFILENWDNYLLKDATHKCSLEFATFSGTHLRWSFSKVNYSPTIGDTETYQDFIQIWFTKSKAVYDI